MQRCWHAVQVLRFYGVYSMKKRPFRINRVYIGQPYFMQQSGKRVSSQEYEEMTRELMDKIYGSGDGA